MKGGGRERERESACEKERGLGETVREKKKKPEK